MALDGGDREHKYLSIETATKPNQILKIVKFRILVKIFSDFLTTHCVVSDERNRQVLAVANM